MFECVETATAKLFGVKTSAMSGKAKSIKQMGDSEHRTTVSKMETVQKKSKQKVYRLDDMNMLSGTMS